MCEKHVFFAAVEQNERSQSLVWVSTPQRGKPVLFYVFRSHNCWPDSRTQKEERFPFKNESVSLVKPSCFCETVEFWLCATLLEVGFKTALPSVNILLSTGKVGLAHIRLSGVSGCVVCGVWGVGVVVRIRMDPCGSVDPC